MSQADRARRHLIREKMTKRTKIAIVSVAVIVVGIVLLYILLLHFVTWNYDHQKIPDTQ